MAFENIRGKRLAGSDTTQSMIVDVNNTVGLVLNNPLEKTIPYITTTGTRECEYGPIVYSADICNTAAEVTQAKSRVVSFQDVFNTWKRFSHRNNTVPPANPNELNNWSYNAVEDSIMCTINSASYIGIVSREQYGDWELDLYLSSDDGDDDTISIILGFNTDNNGVERTLSLLRGPGGNGVVTWAFSYNYTNSRSGITTTRNTTSKNTTVKWGSGEYGATGAEANYSNNANGGWRGMGRCRVKITRKGDIFTCTTSDFEKWDPTLTLLESSKYTINLANDIDGKYFSGKSAYGYGSYSQNKSKYTVISFKGGERVIYDLTANTAHVNTGSGWVVTASRAVGLDIGPGRLVFNRHSGKLFYVDTASEIYLLNGAKGT